MPASEALHLLLLPGDGIGREITNACLALLQKIKAAPGLTLTWEEGLIGGAALDACGDPLPAKTLTQAATADAVLLACVGGPKWDGRERHLRPETGLLRIRKELGLFANLRPVKMYPELAAASPLKTERTAGIDLLILRELTGGLYFGQPRGLGVNADGQTFAQNNMVYTESEIERMAHLAFSVARTRRRTVHSIDKANVLEVSQLWRDVVTRVHQHHYADVTLHHQYVDSASMQLILNPKQFDVILTENLFGDILSDEAAVLPGSIGLLPSASLTFKDQTTQRCRGLFEPVHGSAPDIAGQGIANPLAMFLSLALLFRHVRPEAPRFADLATAIENAVAQFLAQGHRTFDLREPGKNPLNTQEATAEVLKILRFA